MKLRLSTDRLTGLLFAAMGIGGILLSSGHPLGSLGHMRSGFFPMILSCALTGFGAILIGQSFVTESEEVGEVDLTVVGTLLGSVILFGLVVEHIGFVIASVLLIVVSRIPREFRPVEVGLLALVLVVGSVLVFHVGFRSTIPLWPW